MYPPPAPSETKGRNASRSRRIQVALPSTATAPLAGSQTPLGLQLAWRTSVAPVVSCRRPCTESSSLGLTKNPSRATKCIRRAGAMFFHSSARTWRVVVSW